MKAWRGIDLESVERCFHRAQFLASIISTEEWWSVEDVGVNFEYADGKQIKNVYFTLIFKAGSLGAEDLDFVRDLLKIFGARLKGWDVFYSDNESVQIHLLIEFRGGCGEA